MILVRPAIFSLLFTILLSLSVGSLPLKAQDSSAVWHDCHVKKITEKAECATISVPLDYDNPSDGRTVDVFVAKISSTGTEIKDDPFIILPGGPGQAASDSGSLLNAGFNKVRQGREILLIDHRGVGNSNQLNCARVDDMAVTQEGILQYIQTCLDDLEHDPKYFGVDAAQRDYLEVINALGYDQVNLYGVSYGTRTASWLMREAPTLIRSAILDGVLPPEMQLFEQSPKGAEQALQALFTACGVDAACNQAFPNLATRFADWVTALRDAPMRFTVRNPVTFEMESVNFDYVSFVQAVRGILYSTGRSASLPHALDQLFDGNAGPFSALSAAGAALTDTMALGSTLSILCGDEIYGADEAAIAKAGATSFTDDSYYQFWKSACQVWPYTKGREINKEPLNSDVPTLLLSGAVDPVTPYQNGDAWTETLSNVRHLIVPATGHNTAYVGCMPDILAEFVDTLDSASLKAECLQTTSRHAFVTGVMGPSRSAPESIGDSQ